MQEFVEWWATIQWADFSVGAVAAALITGGLGLFAHVYNKRASLTAQKRQFEHDTKVQREQLRHGDAFSKIEIIEKFIRALKAAYKDLEEYKYAIDGEKANGRHSQHYAEQGHWVHADKFEKYKIRDVDRRIEVNKLITQHIEDLNVIRLSITGIAPEYRDDAQKAIDEYKGRRGTLYLLPENDSVLKYHNYDVQKWENILASIRSEH